MHGLLSNGLLLQLFHVINALNLVLIGIYFSLANLIEIVSILLKFVSFNLNNCHKHSDCVILLFTLIYLMFLISGSCIDLGISLSSLICLNISN